MQRRFGGALWLAVMGAVLGAASVAWGQAVIAEEDILRLQVGVYDAREALRQVAAADAARGARIEAELDAISDEAVFLKIQLRRQGRVAASEFEALSTRLDAVRGQLAGDAPAVVPTGGEAAPVSTSAAGRVPARSTEIPAGRELDVRLRSLLDSETAQVEDRFEASTLVDLYRDGRLIIPAGSVVRGVVSGVEKAGRNKRSSSLTLNFDQITIVGEAHPIKASATQAFQQKGARDEAGKLITGAGIGGLVGGLLAGGIGVAAGAVVGTSGTLLATQGPNVELPPGTVVRLRFDEPLVLR
jgi:hypothetical protein